MNEKSFFIILIIFLLTSEFYFMIRNIIKYGIYLLLIIYILKIINPKFSDILKNFIKSFINSDESSIMVIISKLIKLIKSLLNINGIKPLLNKDFLNDSIFFDYKIID
jgi:hypothetical protein